MKKAVKEKTCQNKNCKKKFTPFNSIQKVCSPICAIEYNKSLEEQNKLKEEKKEKRDWKTRRKLWADNLKTLSDLEAEARPVFQKYIRLRDKNLPCISCPTVESKEWHGSHYFNANQFSGLIFHEMNCHKSCNYCNTYMHGNLIQYRIGLVNRYGEEYVKELEEMSNYKRNYKYDREELIEIKKKFLEKIKILEKNQKNIL